MSSVKINFLAGLVSGVAIALYSVLVAYGYIWSAQDVRVWLYNWQTLLSTIIAFLALLAAIFAVRIQVNQTEEHKLDELRRKNLAARLAISQTLSNIVTVQEEIAKELGEFLVTEPPIPTWTSKLTAEDVDIADTQALIQCLETAQGAAVLDVAELISEIQIQVARLRDLRRSAYSSGTTVLRQNVTGYAVDAIFIYARASRMLHYSRLGDLEYEATMLPEVLRESCSLLTMRAGVEEQVTARAEKFKDKWLCSRLAERG